MHAMGALQPSMLPPTMLPSDWHLLVIDLKDCFFTIPFQPPDTVRSAFTVPAINKDCPSSRYEWVVLPQGMKNSPTMCQLYVTWALQTVGEQVPQTIIYHYMDDILLCQPEPLQLALLGFTSTIRNE